MRNWVMTGLATGVKTTRYPAEPEAAAGTSPGLPLLTDAPGQGLSPELVELCPTHALAESGRVDYGRCVHCFRCARSADAAMVWRDGYEWADLTVEGAASLLGRAFGRSLHVRIMDSGDCGACLNEIRQLNGPYYNAHRLGLFITPTPRKADALIVVGPVTEHMKVPLEKAYAAMPGPKRVIAVGACALSGGVFGPSFAAGSGAVDVVPVDVSVPGCPPPPLALLHALLVVVGRKPPSRILSPAATGADVGDSVTGGAS
jgi:Ni,Fe-hydrogenase III small subunit